jgi:hypothetical protein
MSTNEQHVMLAIDDFEYQRPPVFPKWFKRIDMLSGFAAAEIYWIYAIFIAHVLTISVYITDRSTNLRVLSGQIGDLREVIHSNGVVPSLIASLGLFALVWCVVRGSSGTFPTLGFVDRK